MRPHLRVRQTSPNSVASIDMGFPCRYTHSALEVFDLTDLEALTSLLRAAISAIDNTFSLDRDDYPE